MKRTILSLLLSFSLLISLGYGLSEQIVEDNEDQIIIVPVEGQGLYDFQKQNLQAPRNLQSRKLEQQKSAILPVQGHIVNLNNLQQSKKEWPILERDSNTHQMKVPEWHSAMDSRRWKMLWAWDSTESNAIFEDLDFDFGYQMYEQASQANLNNMNAYAGFQSSKRNQMTDSQPSLKDLIKQYDLKYDWAFENSDGTYNIGFYEWFWSSLESTSTDSEGCDTCDAVSPSWALNWMKNRQRGYSFFQVYVDTDESFTWEEVQDDWDQYNILKNLVNDQKEGFWQKSISKKCEEGYFQNSIGNCQSCAEGCTSCQQMDQCKSCSDKFDLVEGQGFGYCFPKCSSGFFRPTFYTSERRFNMEMKHSSRLEIYDPQSMFRTCYSCPEGCSSCIFDEFNFAPFCYVCHEGFLLDKTTNVCQEDINAEGEEEEEFKEEIESLDNSTSINNFISSFKKLGRSTRSWTRSSRTYRSSSYSSPTSTPKSIPSTTPSTVPEPSTSSIRSKNNTKSSSTSLTSSNKKDQTYSGSNLIQLQAFIDCPSGCSNCKSQDTCTSCNQGYYLYKSNGYTSSKSYCYSCGIPNCKRCRRRWNKLVAISCLDGYTLDKYGNCNPETESCSRAEYYDTDDSTCKSCPVGTSVCHYVSSTQLVVSDKCRWNYFMNEEQGLCEKSCGIGEYYDFSEGECTTCPDNCESCRFSSTKSLTCSSCTGSYKLTYDGTCIESCVAGEYFDEYYKMCFSCPSGCSECEYNEFTYSSVCTACPEGYNLNEDMGTCEKECESSQYFNAYYQGCYNCPRKCTKCTQDSYYGNPTCSECVENYSIKNGACYKDQSTSCRQGRFYNYNYKICQKCARGCKSCSFDFDTYSSKCDECRSGYTFSELYSYCYKDCKSKDYYYDFYYLKCIKVPQGCAEAEFDPDTWLPKCSSCKSGYEFDEWGSCLRTSCELGYYYVNETQACEPCSANCEKCQYHEDWYDSQCTQCQSGYALDSYQMFCTRDCFRSNQYWDPYYESCKRCPTGSTSCIFDYYLWMINSTSCDFGYELSPSFQCINKNCQSGSYYNPYYERCESCSDSQCSKCTWNQETFIDECSECIDGQFSLVNGTCKINSTCPLKQYYNYDSFKCEDCSYGCLICHQQVEDPTDNDNDTYIFDENNYYVIWFFWQSVYYETEYGLSNSFATYNENSNNKGGCQKGRGGKKSKKNKKDGRYLQGTNTSVDIVDWDFIINEPNGRRSLEEDQSDDNRDWNFIINENNGRRILGSSGYKSSKKSDTYSKDSYSYSYTYSYGPNYYYGSSYYEYTFEFDYSSYYTYDWWSYDKYDYDDTSDDDDLDDDDSDNSGLWYDNKFSKEITIINDLPTCTACLPGFNLGTDQECHQPTCYSGYFLNITSVQCQSCKPFTKLCHMDTNLTYRVDECFKGYLHNKLNETCIEKAKCRPGFFFNYTSYECERFKVPPVIDLIQIINSTNISDGNGSCNPRGFKIEWIASKNIIETTISGQGDFNGDGIADILIGTTSSTDLAGAHLIFGSKGDMPSPFDLDSLDGTNGFAISAITSYEIGRSVSFAGDINGDGFDDILVSGFKGNNIYVIFGTNRPQTAFFSLENLDGSNGFVITSVFQSYMSYQSIQALGDINGDSLDDIIYVSESNTAYVLYGSRTFNYSIDSYQLTGRIGFKINGFNGYDVKVGGIGDFNNDGHNDFMIGTRKSKQKDYGEAYVVFGPRKFSPKQIKMDYLDGKNGFKMARGDENDDFGSSFSGCGDVNGDGVSDIIINGGKSSIVGRGQSHIIYGKKKKIFDPFLNITKLDRNDGFSIFNNKETEHNTVCGAGDLNNDGINDFMVGTNKFYGSVIYGRKRGFRRDFQLDNIRRKRGFKFTAKKSEGFGEVIQKLGDVNGDGIDDMLAGQYNLEGRVTSYYIMYGLSQECEIDVPPVDKDCEEGEFYKKVLGSCQKCPTGCATCINARNCNSCQEGFVLENKQCQSLCPVYQVWSSYHSHCVNITCEEGQFLTLEGECVPCATGCKTCNNDAGCTSCPANYTLYSNMTCQWNPQGMCSYVFPKTFDLSTLSLNEGVQFSWNGLQVGKSIPVSGAGDFNGDGLNDILIFTPSVTNKEVGGGAYVIYGTESFPATTIELSSLNGPNGFKIYGNNSLLYGTSFNSAGDVNFDGYDDIIIVSSQNSEVYVIFGGYRENSSSFDFNLTTLNGVNGFIITGLKLTDDSLQASSGIGDINSDDIDDFIVCDGQSSCYVIYGRKSFNKTIDASSLNGQNGYRIKDLNAYQIGVQVQGLGDINGDGVNDFAIGVPQNYESPPIGKVFFFLGMQTTQSEFSIYDLNGENGFTVWEEFEQDLFGFSISALGDINGDGINDVGISSQGRVIIGFGSDEGFRSVINASDGTQPGFSIINHNLSDIAYVSGAGDLNNDGLNDILIGGMENGYVFYGTRNTPQIDIPVNSLGHYGFNLTASYDEANGGGYVTKLGDVNGDGFDDALITGMSMIDEETKSYVLFGRECANSQPSTSKCSQGYFLNSALVYCQKCPVGCLDCSNHQTCNQCYPGFDMQSDTYCTSVCKTNQIWNTTVNACYYTSCEKGEYLLNGQCHSCSENCIDCLSKTQCIECQSEDYFISWNGTCELFCPEANTTFLASTGTCQNISQCSSNQFYTKQNNTCTNCSLGCQTCNSSYNCTKCDAPQFVPNTYDGHCTDICKLNGTYWTESQNSCQNKTICAQGEFWEESLNLCKKCGHGCKNCSDASNCNYCESHRFQLSPFKSCEDVCDLNGTIWAGNHCQSKVNCSDGEFYVESDNTCEPCNADLNCLTCSNENQCSSCESPQYIMMVMDFISGESTSSCEDVCQLNGTIWVNNQCEVKKTCSIGEHYVAHDNTCSSCNEDLNCKECSDSQSCTTCYGPQFVLNYSTNSTDKNSCVDICSLNGTIWVNNSCQVKKNCTQGQYYNAKDNTCKACRSSLHCLTCSDSESCTSCLEPQYTMGMSLVTINGTVYYKDKCLDVCQMNGTEWINGQCQVRENCTDQEYYNETENTCHACTSSLNCLTCDDSESCSTCLAPQFTFVRSNNHTWSTGSCVDTCSITGTIWVDGSCQEKKNCSDWEFYQASDNTCQPCNASLNCLTCSESDSCDSCQEPQYTLGMSLVAIDGGIYYKDICLDACSQNGTEWINGSCQVQPNCSEGEYYHTSENTCIPCNENLNCLTCSDSDSCDTCQEPQYYLGMSLVTGTDGTVYYQDVCLDVCSLNGTQWINGSCQVKPNCSDGKFYQVYDNTCQDCTTTLNCLTCNNSESCTSCQEPQYTLTMSLLGTDYKDQCVDVCSLNNTHPHWDGTKCISCAFNEYFETASLTCQDCSSDCIQCSNSTMCEVCHPSHFNLVSGQCIDSCAQNGTSWNGNQCVNCAYNQYFDETQLKCANCSYNCVQCSNSTVCEQCHPSHFYLSDGICADECALNGSFWDGSKCKKCEYNQFYNSTFNKCDNCSANCIQCDSSDVCNTCHPSHFYLSDGICADICSLNGTHWNGNQCISCDTNQYLDSSLVCRDCSDNCIQCSNSSVCEVCDPSHYQIQTDGKCGDICALNGTNWDGTKCESCGYSQFFATTNLTCQDCSSDCVQCSNNSVCEVCHPSHFNLVSGQCIDACALNDTTWNGNRCVNCAQNQYFDETQLRCNNCSDNCIQCSNDSICEICNQSHFYLSNGQCADSCVQNGTNWDGSQCVSCLFNQFFDETSMKCENCSDNCIQCSSKDVCDACHPSHYTQSPNGNGSCVDECILNNQVWVPTENACRDKVTCELTAGEYYNEVLNTCGSCSSNCDVCSSEAVCTSCSSNRYVLQIDKCVDICSLNDTEWSDQFNMCITVPSCSSGQYLDATLNKCFDCSANCIECTSASECTNCDPSHYSLISGYCEESCALNNTIWVPQDNQCQNKAVCQSYEYYIETTNTCTNCSDHCLTCSGPQTCSQCEGPRYIKSSSNGQCVDVCVQNGTKWFDYHNSCQTVKSCSGAFFYDIITNECLPCSSNCASCSSSNECTSCVSSRYALSHLGTITTCVDECNDDGMIWVESVSECQIDNSGSCDEDTFYNSQTNTCDNCPENCSACTSLDQCTACKLSYFEVDNGVCVDKCVKNNQVYVPATETCENQVLCESQGQFRNTNDNKCYDCIEGCQTCSDQQKCDICVSPQYQLQNSGVCTDVCINNGTYFNVEAQKCYKTCNESQQFDESLNDCRNICPPKTFWQQSSSSNSCPPCSPNCNFCSDQSTCLVCESARYILDTRNRCIDACALNDTIWNPETQLCESSTTSMRFSMTVSNSQVLRCRTSSVALAIIQGYPLNLLLSPKWSFEVKNADQVSDIDALNANLTSLANQFDNKKTLEISDSFTQWILDRVELEISATTSNIEGDSVTNKTTITLLRDVFQTITNLSTSYSIDPSEAYTFYPAVYYTECPDINDLQAIDMNKLSCSLYDASYTSGSSNGFLQSLQDCTIPQNQMSENTVYYMAYSYSPNNYQEFPNNEKGSVHISTTTSGSGSTALFETNIDIDFSGDKNSRAQQKGIQQEGSSSSSMTTKIIIGVIASVFVAGCSIGLIVIVYAIKFKKKFKQNSGTQQENIEYKKSDEKEKSDSPGSGKKRTSILRSSHLSQQKDKLGKEDLQALEFDNSRRTPAILMRSDYSGSPGNSPEFDLNYTGSLGTSVMDDNNDNTGNAMVQIDMPQ